MLYRLFVLSILLSIFPTVTYASTTVNYPSPCKYFDKRGTLKASTTCQINFGTLGASGGARFIVTFPGRAEVVIYLYINGKVETNQISSKAAIAGGNIVIATEEGEIFIFKANER
ncbi:hypothetical protein [Phormidesmis priestleyi]